MDYREICLRACEIAREAGEYIAVQRDHFSFADVEYKGTQDMVSYVDKSAEKILVNRLRLLTPEAGYITEEGTASAHHERLKWVIDPLDGTTNFIHGLPPYCVSLALMEGDQVVVGVVYEITLREMFYAWKGSEAYLNDKVIRTSSIDSMSNALVAIGCSHSMVLEVEDFMESFSYYQKNTNGVRRLGSAAADLVYVACGRFDAFSQVQLSPWDVAGGAFIAQRAGAIVTDYTGGTNFIFGREIIACNPFIYPEFKKSVR